MRAYSERVKRYISVITALVILLSCFSVNASAAVSASSDTVTTTAALNLRSSASSSSACLFVFEEDTVLTLLEDSENGWAHVTDGTHTGYVSTAYLDLPAGSEVEMYAITTADLNLRSGRGSSYSVELTLPEGARVEVTDNSDDSWTAVEYGSSSGYVSNDYIIIGFALSGDTAKSSKTAEPTEPAVYSHRSASFSGLPAVNTGDSSSDDILRLIPVTSSLTLSINERFTLTVMDEKSKPINGGLKYSSSNTSVASVSSSGVVKGLKKGKATITVSDSSGSAKAECSVNVKSDVAPTQPAAEKPTQAPTQKPTQAPSQDKLTISATSATVYVGCYYQLKATSDSTVKWSTSDKSVASVSGEGIVTALSEGTATITAKTSTKSAACKLTVKKGSSVSLSNTSATVTVGKTFLARSYTSGVTWSSSDTSVATVNNGYILAKKAGKTIVTAASSGGAATILVTVKAAAPVRFAYTSPNCASRNEKVNLIAITDKNRTAVRFKITSGSTTTTVDATSSVKDGNTLVWTGSIKLITAGLYQVVAYSQLGGEWSTCDDAKTTAFVANSTDKKTTVCTERRASDDVIRLIANFEGYISSIYDDPLTGDPTVGYGRVIYAGQQFYNTMTKNEAFAYLVQTVNNEGYASKVNSFLIGNNVKFNQQQFDALVCLVYNTGSGVLTGDASLKNALLDCHDGSSGATTYYINGSGVRIRKGAGTNYDIIRELPYDTKLKILSKDNSAWYKVELTDGTKGYVSSDYISSRSTGGKLDLNYVDKQNLINKFCQYHHAGGDCVYGLLYRRVDEMEMFFYGDYERNYGVYKYDIDFTCAINPYFHT